MEPESSLAHLQEPVTCSYSNPGQSSACPLPFHFLKIHSNITLPFMSRSSRWSLSSRFPHQNHICTFPLVHTCCMPCLSRSSWFDYL